MKRAMVGRKRLFVLSVALLTCVVAVAACSKRKSLPMPAGLFDNYPGPQIAVEPRNVRLGISTMLKTPIVIGGTGFQKGDSVFVDMVTDDVENPRKIPIDAGDVGDDGSFLIEVSRDTKLIEILRMTVDPVDKKPTVVGDPIATGAYTLRATSVNSDRRAECVIIFDPPSKMDKIKDRISALFGKIKKK